MIALRKMLVVANTDWFLWNFLSAFLALHLRRGIAVTAVSPAGRYIEDLRRLGLTWLEFPMARGRGSAGNALASARSLARALRDCQPDLVMLITAKPVLLGKWAIQRDQKLISVLPGLGRALAGSGTRSVLDRWAIRQGVRWATARTNSRVVFHQASDRDRVLGTSTAVLAKTSLIPGWGVDLGRFSGPRAPQTPPLVVLISRMLSTKGIAEFVEAAETCRRSIEAKFVLVGEPDVGNPDAVASSQLEAWEARGSVEWWGHRQDIPEILSRASICVLPSKYGEGVPQSLIEAAAAGVPIVASDIPGCREVVTHDGNGLLVPPGDAQALAEAVLALLRSPERSDEMGQVGRTMARERYSTAVILDAYRRLYETLGLQLPDE